MQIHPVISIAHLEPCLDPKADPYHHPRPTNPPPVMEELGEWQPFKVEKVLESRQQQYRRGKTMTEYLVRWKGYGPQHNKWYGEDLLEGCLETLINFESAKGNAEAVDRLQTRLAALDLEPEAEPQQSSDTKERSLATAASMVNTTSKLDTAQAATNEKQSQTGTTLLKETPHFLNYHKVPALSIPQTSPETDAPTTEPSQSSTASPLEKEPRPVTDSTSVETHQLIVNLPTKEASALEEAICLAGIEEENLEEERETTRDGKRRATSHDRLSTEEVSGSHTIEERELLIQEASLAQEKADIEVRLLRKARDKYDRKEFARGLSGKRNQLAVERNLEKEQRLLERQRLEQADIKQDRLEQERLDQRAEGSLQEQPHFNMSNQEGSSNPRLSGLPSSSNHPFSGNAFSAEQIRVLSQLFDEKLRLSANLQGPPRPPGAPGPAGPILYVSTPASFRASDLGFFHPDVPESYGTGDVIFNSKETIYREVYTFIKRVEDYALLVGEEKVAENLSTCLRGNALNWYLQELDDFTRRAL
ncbi:Chromo domain/shadow [Lasallia pustulata]|uniref:Chromo domain/shadow n=1 Tax=Lasallia pustulata TaxID=136370 RepID=A0A1W5DAT8_9LECA|nr:Chromo domain/shadow [Lasallia pustulata]